MVSREKINVNQISSENETFLYLAVKNSAYDVMEYLLTSNADANLLNSDPKKNILHMACYQRDYLDILYLT